VISDVNNIEETSIGGDIVLLPWWFIWFIW
jgi:hypothetical protein